MAETVPDGDAHLCLEPATTSLDSLGTLLHELIGDDLLLGQERRLATPVAQASTVLGDVHGVALQPALALLLHLDWGGALRVQGLGCMVADLWSRVKGQGYGLRVKDLGPRVKG